MEEKRILVLIVQKKPSNQSFYFSYLFHFYTLFISPIVYFINNIPNALLYLSQYSSFIDNFDFVHYFIIYSNLCLPAIVLKHCFR